MIPVKNKLQLAINNIACNQNLYFFFLINFSITVMPFQNMATENIISDIIKIKEVFFRMPKYETGCVLGSNSGNRYMHSIGDKIPIKMDDAR